MGQRITRAKKTLTDANVPFETPRANELQQRVQSVLLVIYLIFNEGYTATSGEEWSRTALVEEALRLARMLVKLIPEEPEAHALLALMELNASRSAARRGENGEAVLLPDQDRYPLGSRPRSNEVLPLSIKLKDSAAVQSRTRCQAAITAVPRTRTRQSKIQTGKASSPSTMRC